MILLLLHHSGIQMCLTNLNGAPRLLMLCFGLLLAVMVPARSGAADQELFAIQGDVALPVNYRTPAPVRVQVGTASVRGAVPLPVGDHGQLVPAFSYRLQLAPYVQPTEVPALPPVHWPEVSLTGLRWWPSGWQVYGQVSAAMAGDLTAIDAGVVRLAGLLTLRRRLSERLTLGAGATLTWAFGQLAPIPLLTLDWNPSDAVELQVVLPVRLTLTHTWHRRTRVGMRAGFVGNAFAIRDDTVLDTFCPTDAAAGACLERIAYSAGNATLMVGQRVLRTAEDNGGLWLELHGGVSFLRRFELLSVAETPLEGADTRLPGSAFASFGIRYLK
ncbi:MAG: DUF6268 family outer membrane beta-barrel protein [Myxococcota bacterium]